MNEQKTRDITLATILYTKGAKLEGHEKTKSGNIVFYFKKTKDLDRLIEAYYRGEIQTEFFPKGTIEFLTE
jgi:hypothetical protein